MNHKDFNSEEIDISKILYMVWNRKLLIIFFLIVSSFVAIFNYYTIPITYTSKINIQVNLDSKGAMSIIDSLTQGSVRSSGYGAEIELIKSRKLLSQVVDELHLKKTSLELENTYKASYYVQPYLDFINKKIEKFKKIIIENKKESLSDRIIITKKLQDMLSISYTESGKFLTVSIESYSPSLSTKIVNAISDTYIKYKNEQLKKQKENTLNWLSNELNTIKKDIIKAERESSSLSNVKDSPDIKTMIELKKDELNSLSFKKSELEQKIEVDKIYYKQLEGITDPIIILESPLIKATPEIERSQQEISMAENRFLEVSLKYGPKHPTYIAAKENLSNDKGKLKRQVDNLLETSKLIFEVEKNKVQKLEESLSKIKIELQKLNQSEEVYLKKLREIEAYQNLYNITLKRFQEAQSISNLEQEVATVLDYSLVEDAKESSKNILLSALTLILGLFVSVVVSIFLGSIDQKIHTENDLTELTETIVLTSLPKIKIKKNNFPTYNFIEDKIYLESIYRLRTRLRTVDNDKNVISITSAIAKEGKSTTAIHLAKALSELEKVLIIDIDFRHHAVTNYLNIPQKKPGLSDVILRQAKLSDAIIRNTKEGFDIFGVGTKLDSPNTLLSSDIMKKILIHLRKHYDKIIIETPPVQLFSDAEMISKLVDTTLLVVKSNHTKKKDITETIVKLEQVNTNILGIILNQTTLTQKKKQYRKYVQGNIS